MAIAVFGAHNVTMIRFGHSSRPHGSERPTWSGPVRLLICCVLLVVLGAPMWAQRKVSVDQLEAFITSSLQLHHPDKQIASLLDSFSLTDHLDARRVENLQGMGVGPRTLKKLRELSEESANLPEPEEKVQAAARPTRPAPSSVEQGEILNEARLNALNYTEGLPNFLCTQVTRRRVDVSGSGNYHLMDTIQERLRYEDGSENYEVVMVNGDIAKDLRHDQLGGTVTSGEWATMLYEIFEPSTETQFSWERWATLRAKRMYVFDFRVRQNRSQYRVSDQSSGLSMVAGYAGSVYIDQQTNKVMRIRMDIQGLDNFPIEQIALDLNYDYVDIGGQDFVLPIKSTTKSRAGSLLSWNDVEFRNYQKFTTGATINFDVPEELPEEMFEETPDEGGPK